MADLAYWQAAGLVELDHFLFCLARVVFVGTALVGSGLGRFWG